MTEDGGVHGFVRTIPQTIANGIVENAGWTIFLSLFVALVAGWGRRLTVPLPLGLLAAIGLALTSLLAVYYLNEARRLGARVAELDGDVGARDRDISDLETALQHADELFEAGASLLLLLPSLVGEHNRTQAIEQTVKEFLRDCSYLFDQEIRRGTVLRPAEDREWLVPWVGHEMPDESLRRSRLYIGPRPDATRRRGIAGHAFVQGQLKVLNIEWDGATAVPSDQEYVNFERPDRNPPYRSFSAVPILWEEGAPPLGVLCLDTMSAGRFDSEDDQEVLWLLADRLAAAVALYDELESRYPSQRPGNNP